MKNFAAAFQKTNAMVIAVLGLVFFGTTQAAAAVVTFDTLPAGDYPVYSEAGFSLRSVANDTSTPFGDVATTGLFTPTRGAFPIGGFAVQDLILTDDASLPFSLFSLDLFEATARPSPQTFFLTGTRADATTVSAMFTTDGIAGDQTFAVSGFTNLVSLRLGGGGSSDVAGIDNLVLAPSVASVAEPNPLVLLALGSLALVAPRLKRRAK